MSVNRCKELVRDNGAVRLLGWLLGQLGTMPSLASNAHSLTLENTFIGCDAWSR